MTDVLALGTDGSTAPPRSNGELVFAAPWESRSFAMVVALAEQGVFTLDEFREQLIAAIDRWERAHDPDGPGYQSTVRLLHYFPMDGDDFAGGRWRAGAHTDYDCLTLLFQRDGQSGLQVCPGDDATSGRWTSIDPDEALITCNIGDMLMR